ncbi:MAG: hypothetical protein HYY14_04245 [Candidatus Omnitrophica bacterium]|nr:hypothetical protein [Candidatus Omnitrophota bacterium]
MLKGVCAGFLVATGVGLVCLKPISHPLLDQLLTRKLGQALGADIQAKDLAVGPLYGISARDISIRREDVFYAQAASLYTRPRLVLMNIRPHIRLDLELEDLVIGQDYMSTLLATQTLNRVPFSKSRAQVEIRPFGLEVNQMTAEGSSCLLEAKGAYDYNGRLNFDIKFFMGPALAAEIPAPLKQEMLRVDPSGRVLFTLRVAGTRDLPSIEFVSDRHRFKAQTRKL